MSALALRRQGVVWWTVMTVTRSALVRPALAASAGLALLFAAASPFAAAAPASDALGYVDSTARCTAPASAVAFGRTDSSRVAICESPDGDLEYRGVRVRDGAKLILAATRSGDDFVAESSGATYTVSPSALIISVEEKIVRDEPMVEYHGSDAPEAESSPTPSTPLPPPLPAEVGGDG